MWRLNTWAEDLCMENFLSDIFVWVLFPSWLPPHFQIGASAMNEVFLGIHNWVTHVWQSGRLITIMWTPRPADTFQVIFIVSLSLVLLDFGSVTSNGSHCTHTLFSNLWMTFIHFTFTVQALAIFSLVEHLQSKDQRISRSQRVIQMMIKLWPWWWRIMSIVPGNLFHNKHSGGPWFRIVS